MSIKIIICSDIFGHTNALQQVALAYTNLDNISVSVVSPYPTQAELKHIDETEAIDELSTYQHYLKHCGHEQYAALITAELTSTFSAAQSTIIIGFSAGASACWQAIRNLPRQYTTKVKHFIGFYPSQIRHHTQHAPSCPVSLIFPESEAHFDLCPVINQLNNHANVCSIQTPWQHGFFNPLSVNFNQSAHQHCQRLLLNTEYLIQPKLFCQALTHQLSQT